MIYCTKCGTANNDGSNYCVHDGYPLYKFFSKTKLVNSSNINHCQSCGADYLSNSQYCHLCGESFEKLKSNTRLTDHHKPLMKSIESKEIKQAFSHTLPLVIITLVAIWILSFMSIGQIDTTPYDYSNIEPELEFVHQYQYWGNYEQAKRRAMGEDVLQMESAPEGQTRESVMTPLDLMLFSNLVQVETVRHAGPADANEEANHVTYMKSGMVYYLFISMVSIFIAGFVYSKKRPFSDWKRLMVYALIFSFLYAFIMFILSLFTTINSGDTNYGRAFTYSFVSSDALWKGFLVSFISVSGGFIIGKGTIRSLSIFSSVKQSYRLLIILILLFSIAGSFLYFFILNDFNAFQSIEKSAIISAPVIIFQVGIILFNLVFQNAFVFNVATPEANSVSYHMISKTQRSSDIVPEGFLDALSSLDQLLWVLVGLVGLVIVYLSKHFSHFLITERVKSIAWYSLVFAVIATLFSYGSTFYLSESSADYQSKFVIGFTVFRSMLMFFSITFCLTLVSSYIFKASKGDS